MNLKYCIAILFTVVLSVNVLAQSQSYKEAMKKQVAAFKSAKGINSLQKAADGFSAIALSEKKEWLPFYYAGLCNVLVAFEKNTADIDSYCDKAESSTVKCNSLSKNNSEIFVLKSMIAAARIVVNEKARAKKYGSLSTKFALEAIKLNPNNPRAYLLKAQNILHTPEALGGGTKKAKPVLETALEKEKTFKPETVLYPDWCKTEIEKELNKINSKSTHK